ncbi:hypothetical protein DFH11DRAFT_1547959 [Phellopilus nigrolimitatus]|nr:hypothetical protein DFH11DRAFT_1547959 [Phellopilus nigrolimitatus]
MASSGDHYVFEATQEIFTLQYYTIASITVLYYDHIITFRPSCKNFVRFDGYLSLITQVTIATLLGLAIVATSAVSSDLPAKYSSKSDNWSYENGFGGSIFRSCLPAFIRSTIPFEISFILTLIFDGFIFTLTVARTWQTIREKRRCSLHSQLTWLVVRDGSIYFAYIEYDITTALTVLWIKIYQAPSLSKVQEIARYCRTSYLAIRRGPVRAADDLTLDMNVALGSIDNESPSYDCWQLRTRRLNTSLEPGTIRSPPVYNTEDKRGAESAGDDVESARGDEGLTKHIG